MTDSEQGAAIEFAENPLAMFRSLVDVEDKVVVDVGCGLGANAAALDAMGAVVTGIEIDEDRVAAARAKQPGTGVSFRQGLAEDLRVRVGRDLRLHDFLRLFVDRLWR